MTARTVPTMPTWLAGQKLTASLMNQISTFANFLANPPMVRAYASFGQVITNTADMQLQLDAVTTSGWDTDSGRGASPYSYTIPVGMTGRWQFSYVAAYPNSTGARAIFLKKNGTRWTGSTYEIAAPNDLAMVGGTCTVNCTAGDTVNIWTWQNSGGSLTLVTSPDTSMFEGRLVSFASP